MVTYVGTYVSISMYANTKRLQRHCIDLAIQLLYIGLQFVTVTLHELYRRYIQRRYMSIQRYYRSIIQYVYMCVHELYR